MIQLTGTAACILRDELSKAWFSNQIELSEITNRLGRMVIPEFLKSQIIQMCEYRKYDRITDPIEQAMEKAIHFQIVRDIIKTSLHSTNKHQ